MTASVSGVSVPRTNPFFFADLSWSPSAFPSQPRAFKAPWRAVPASVLGSCETRLAVQQIQSRCDDRVVHFVRLDRNEPTVLVQSKADQVGFENLIDSFPERFGRLLPPDSFGVVVGAAATRHDAGVWPEHGECRRRWLIGGVLIQNLMFGFDQGKQVIVVWRSPVEGLLKELGIVSGRSHISGL
jgi:hypothetical protein